VQSWGVLIVKGVGENGHREILSVESGNSENETTWAQVFQQLWDRGLRGVVYGVSDEHQGLRAAVARYFQGLGWQRCQVHYQRNAQQQVPLRERAALAARLRDVFNGPDLATAHQRLNQVITQYRGTHPKLADWLERTAEEALTVFTLPPAHRVKLRSTNGLEAFNGTIARRTRVVRIFPNEASCVRLVSAATTTGFVGIYTILSFGAWLVLLAVAWVSGFAVQAFGKWLRLIKHLPDGVDAKEFWKAELEFYKRLGVVEQRRYELLGVIKQTCGNTFVALLVLLVIFVIDGTADWISSGSTASTTVSFAALYSIFAFIIVVIGLAYLLRRVHNDYVQKQYDFMNQALEWNKGSKN